MLPLHVANKIAAGEVVERPASVVKELVENSIDAGAKHIHISIVQGGRKLIQVEDDGCGMIKDDALLALERQATSKILDIEDIENIDTLGFRGEAIPSIASVSRFTMITRRHDADEGTKVQVNAGTVAEVSAAGCPPGTRIEVRDLFCNVPVRQKFLRSYLTEERHVKEVFTVHALAHPQIGFELTVDSREEYNLPPAETLEDRVRELFSGEYLEQMITLGDGDDKMIQVTGLIEKPNQLTPTRREQYIFVNGRPATAPSIQYAMKEAYPRKEGDAKPSTILFIKVPPKDVDVNVHPTKREVRFRNNAAVKQAIIDSIAGAILGQRLGTATNNGVLGPGAPSLGIPSTGQDASPISGGVSSVITSSGNFSSLPSPNGAACEDDDLTHSSIIAEPIVARPVQEEMTEVVNPGARKNVPWAWFKFLCVTDSGFLLVETDEGIVIINPKAAIERITFEKLAVRDEGGILSQMLLIPEVVKLSPPEFARIKASINELEELGWKLEEFGRDTFKIEALPQLVNLPPAALLGIIAKDLGDTSYKKTGDRWRKELIAKSIARQTSRNEVKLNAELGVKLVEELATCRMPYVTPKGKITMTFHSNRKLNHEFAID